MAKIRQALASLVFGLTRFGSAFRRTGVRGKLILLGAALFMGGDVFANRIGRGLLKTGFHGLMIAFFLGDGFGYLTGTQTLGRFHIGFYAALMLSLWTVSYLVNLTHAVMTVERGVYLVPPWRLNAKRAIVERGKAFRDYRALWKASDAPTRFALASPFLWMGGYQIRHGAVIKGLLLTGIELLFGFYMLAQGVYDIADFISLDTSFLPPEFVRPSAFNIVYGLLAFMAVIGFLWIYVRNVKHVTVAVKDRLYREKPFLLELRELKDHKLYVTLLSFPIAGILLFTVLPLIFMITIAFTGYAGSGQHFGWRGFDVFGDLLLIRENVTTLLSVVEWTLIWAFFATFTNYFGGIFLASMINKKGIRGKGVWRTVFIIAMATPQFVSLLIMNQMFAVNGPVNQALLNAGFISEAVNFWGNQTNARILIIVINMWIGIPYLMLLTSGILMNIPAELYEAAIIEGANRRQLFFKITMPYMLYVTAPLLVTGFIHNINNFNVIFLLTQGKPLGVGLVNAGGTDILITWLYQLTRTYRLYNLSAAIGIIIFLISAAFSLSVYRRTSSYQREGEFAA